MRTGLLVGRMGVLEVGLILAVLVVPILITLLVVWIAKHSSEPSEAEAE